MKSPSRELLGGATAVEGDRWLRLLGDVTVPLIIAVVGVGCGDYFYRKYVKSILAVCFDCDILPHQIKDYGVGFPKSL